jgi:hypothetical protein
MQKSLFNTEPDRAVKKTNAIAKITAKGKPLSKNQQAFNRLTIRIANLKKEIEEVNDKLRVLQNIYEKEIRPEVVALGGVKIEMAHLLHEKRKKVKLTKSIKSNLDDLIYDLLDDAFCVVAPTDKDKELFNAYNDVSFEEETERQQADISEMFAEMLYQQTGLKIDPSVLNAQNPDFEAIQAHLEEQLNNKFGGDNEKPGRKKSQRTIDKEAREKQKKELKQKSIRSIYLSLAKILHPDTEADENTKAEKEEYMKQVTVAYNNKNLPDLLELEMQWVHKHENQLNNTPENTLKLYNELLKEQVENLKDELFFVTQNPAFNAVAHLSAEPLSRAIEVLKAEKKSYKKMYKNYAKYNSMLVQEANTYAVITGCINNFGGADEDDFDDFLMQMAMHRRS